MSTDDLSTSKMHERTIKKAKRKMNNQEEQPIIDEETGEQLEFEDDSDRSEGDVQHMDDQEVVQ
jgi:hypothetical protein